MNNLDLSAEMEWARKRLRLETLDAQGRDSLDFHAVSVMCLQDVIRHAFEAGRLSNMSTRSHTPSMGVVEGERR